MEKNELELLDWMRSVDERDLINITRQIVDNTSEKDIEITYGWDKTAYTFKTITEWKVGYIFYDKVPSISKIIKEITKRRKKEKEVNQWAVVLPKAYAKKYSKQLNALNIHTIEEKKHKEISTLTGGKLYISPKHNKLNNKWKTEELKKKEMLHDIGKGISVDVILRKAKRRGCSEEEAEKLLNKLKYAGDVFEPERGIIQRIE